jgi:hypothetical protein
MSASKVFGLEPAACHRLQFRGRTPRQRMAMKQTDRCAELPLRCCADNQACERCGRVRDQCTGAHDANLMLKSKDAGRISLLNVVQALAGSHLTGITPRHTLHVRMATIADWSCVSPTSWPSADRCWHSLAACGTTKYHNSSGLNRASQHTQRLATAHMINALR